MVGFQTKNYLPCFRLDIDAMFWINKETEYEVSCYQCFRLNFYETIKVVKWLDAEGY